MKKLSFILVLAIVLLTLSSCGSSNISTEPRSPSIHDLKVWPLYAATGQFTEGQNANTIVVTLSLFFLDLDKDISTLYVNWSNTLGASGSFSQNISNPLNSGTIDASFTVDTASITTYTFEVYAIDNTGLSSNTLTTTLAIQ